MSELLTQSRTSIKQNILGNPSIATWSTPSYIDNGYGTMIPDPSGTSTDYTERVRVSHGKSGVMSNEETPAGLGSSYSLFLLAAYSTKIKAGLVITVNELKYTVGTMDTMRKHGGIIGYQAPLVLVG